MDLNQVTDQATSAKDDVVQKVREEFHLQGKVRETAFVYIEQESISKLSGTPLPHAQAVWTKCLLSSNLIP